MDYKDEKLPFDPEKMSFRQRVGRGVSVEVFLLESQDKNIPSYALKVNHAEKGGVDKLTQYAAKQKKEHEEMVHWYKDVPNIIPEEFFFVGSNPRDSKPAVMSVQTFVSGKMRDIFSYGEAELLEVLRGDERLKKQFCAFVERTKALRDEKGKMIDVIGEENVSIIENNDKKQLIFLDPYGSADSNEARDRSKEEQKQKIERLERISQEVVKT
ncbi:MAG: hypothetical protein KC736_02110 [Candidatus Moranbacteria bacterium]|nr:hypothetical protein [Candidatus Moranbacteria bacterium]